MKRPIQAKNAGFYNYLSVKKYRNVVCAEGGEGQIRQKNTQNWVIISQTYLCWSPTEFVLHEPIVVFDQAKWRSAIFELVASLLKPS
ncbi:MAG: hypothetical protein IPJ20_22725 [Flammeovirgaceae bacterium]|nr:hypothetical protein [Flammeovirgaceae bacterium]